MSRYLYLSAIVVTILLFCIVNYPAVFEFYDINRTPDGSDENCKWWWDPPTTPCQCPPGSGSGTYRSDATITMNAYYIPIEACSIFPYTPRNIPCSCPTPPPPPPTRPPPPITRPPPPPPLVTTSTSVTLIVIDGDGNMGNVSVTTPSLSPILSTALIVCLDGDNLQTVSPGDIYTSYPGKAYRLLISDSTGNFSIISSHSFTPCYVYPNGSMNGVPQRDGTCQCTGYWVGGTCTSCGHGTTNINGGCHYALFHGEVIRIYTIDYTVYGTAARQYLKASTVAMDAPYDKSFVFLGDPDANSQFVWQPTYDDPNNNTKGMLMVKGGAFDNYYAYVPISQTTMSTLPGCLDKVNRPGDHRQHLIMCLKPNNYGFYGGDTSDFQLTSTGRGAYQMSGVNGVASKGVPLQIESLCSGSPSMYLPGFTRFQDDAFREPLYLNIEVQETDGAFYPIDMIA